jgi:hypothetical protein
VQQWLEHKPPVKAETPEQNRAAAVETIVSSGVVHLFRYEMANCDAEAAKILWEKKEPYFRKHPKLQKIYNNKLKEGMAQ